MLDIKPYPVDYHERGHFSFFWLRMAIFSFLAYYTLEMVSHVIFFSNSGNVPHERTWRIIDAAIYAIGFVFLSFQMVSFGVTFRNYENRVRSRRTFIVGLILAVLIIIYEYLMVNMPIEERKHSDYTVLFILLLVSHYYVIINLKRTINIIGREKKVRTGVSVFYTLFAFALVIRYLLQFVLIIFLSFVVNPVVFVYYAELIMTYITAAIAVITCIYILIDVRKIKIAQMLEVVEEEVPSTKSPSY